MKLTWLQVAARVSSFYTIVPGGGDSQTSKQNLISLPVSNAAVSPKNVSHVPWGPHAHAMMTWVSLSHGPTPPPATSEKSFVHSPRPGTGWGAMGMRDGGPRDIPAIQNGKRNTSDGVMDRQGQ